MWEYRLIEQQEESIKARIKALDGISINEWTVIRRIIDTSFEREKIDEKSRQHTLDVKNVKSDSLWDKTYVWIILWGLMIAPIIISRI